MFLEYTIEEYEKVLIEDNEKETYIMQLNNIQTVTGNEIKHYINNKGYNEINNINDIINAYTYLNNSEYYNVQLNYKGFETVIMNLSNEKNKWAYELWVSNDIYNMYGEYIILPNHIDVISNGYFAFPTPSLSVISSPFGYREDPITKERDFHSGIDITGNNAHGKPVISIADGTVINKGSTSIEGNFITIRHIIENEIWTSTYCHLSQTNVSLNQEVLQGDVIGAVGDTGRSTGNHLHLTLKFNNQLVDPLEYIQFY